MTFPSVPEAYQWLTTIDVARTLQISADGVRWLARSGRLKYERTRSGQRLFRAGAVDALAKARGEARRASRAARLIAIRPQMLRVGIEPRQLALDFSARLRLVGSRAKGRKVA